MLLGLLHDIGMLPILRYAEKYPEIASNYQGLRNTVRKLHGEVGSVIMKKWNFAADFITVVTAADDWFRDPVPQADYCDLVMIAQLLSFMGKDLNRDTQSLDGRELPLITDLPAYHKLGLDHFTAENSVEILHNAKDEINHALQLLAM
jgi:HD-like signal output (HDOD) protein